MTVVQVFVQVFVRISAKTMVHAVVGWCLVVSLGMTGVLFSPLVYAQSQTASSPANATDIPISRIGIVDINGVLERSTAIAQLRAVIDEEDRRFQESIEQERAELEQAERQLTADRANLSEEEFNRRRQEFDNRVTRIQQRVQRNRQGFNESLRSANEQIRDFLIQIISEIASEHGFVIVLQRQHVVVFDTAFDISDEALIRLNERTRDIKITPSSASE
ncbi:MAG: OmpH family outer membrane protein [Proteobacteria bacterium]|nr:OmpH family outer membrane protein [Pseudomonadota bacterium]